MCDCFSIALPILMTLSAMTPSPTQRFIPASPFAAVEPVSPFDHADASLASGAPFLAVAEPALLLTLLQNCRTVVTARRIGDIV
jgi:hypothetical protein